MTGLAYEGQAEDSKVGFALDMTYPMRAVIFKHSLFQYMCIVSVSWLSNYGCELFVSTKCVVDA